MLVDRLLLHQMAAALQQQRQSATDAALTAEYDQAVAAAPQLVATETKFVDFLRTERLDPVKAATRLALYWKHRKLIFGTDRWLLPMNQTGQGALSVQDVQFLRTGYIVVHSTAAGGPLCIMHMSRLQVYPPGHTNTRIVFYLATVCTDIPLQTEGLTVIRVITSDPRPPMHLDPQGWKMVHEALPMRFKQQLVAQAYELYKDTLLDMLSYQDASLVAFRTRHCPNRIQGDSVQSVLEQLLSRGIPRQALPLSLGGEYSYDSFLDWTRMRLSVEGIMSSALPFTSNLRTNMMMPPQHSNHATWKPRALPQREPQALVQVVPSKNQKKRKSNAPPPRPRHHSRQPLSGQISVASTRAPPPPSASQVVTSVPRCLTMGEQCHQLHQRNRAIRLDNSRLEKLLQQALRLVNEQQQQQEGCRGPR